MSVECAGSPLKLWKTFHHSQFFHAVAGYEEMAIQGDIVLRVPPGTVDDNLRVADEKCRLTNTVIHYNSKSRRLWSNRFGMKDHFDELGRICSCTCNLENDARVIVS